MTTSYLMLINCYQAILPTGPFRRRLFSQKLVQQSAEFSRVAAGEVVHHPRRFVSFQPAMLGQQASGLAGDSGRWVDHAVFAKLSTD